MSESEEKPANDLDRARSIVQADAQHRAEEFAREYETLKKKWGMQLVANMMIVPLQQ